MIRTEGDDQDDGTDNGDDQQDSGKVDNGEAVENHSLLGSIRWFSRGCTNNTKLTKMWRNECTTCSQLFHISLAVQEFSQRNATDLHLPETDLLMMMMLIVLL